MEALTLGVAVLGLFQGAGVIVIMLLWNRINYLTAKLDGVARDLNRLIGACPSCPEMGEDS